MDGLRGVQLPHRGLVCRVACSEKVLEARPGVYEWTQTSVYYGWKFGRTLS